MIDLYETHFTADVLADFVRHIERLRDKIIKLGISAEKPKLRAVRKALAQSGALGRGQIYFSTDMEETKTWLVTSSR